MNDGAHKTNSVLYQGSHWVNVSLWPQTTVYYCPGCDIHYCCITWCISAWGKGCCSWISVVGCEYNMMTSWQGNSCRIFGPLWGEYTGHRWIPLTKGQWRGFRYFFDVSLGKLFEQTDDLSLICNAMPFQEKWLERDEMVPDLAYQTLFYLLIKKAKNNANMCILGKYHCSWHDDSWITIRNENLWENKAFLIKHL